MHTHITRQETLCGPTHKQVNGDKALLSLDWYFQTPTLVLILLPAQFLKWISLKWVYHIFGSYMEIESYIVWAKPLFDFTLQTKRADDYEQSKMKFSKWIVKTWNLFPWGWFQVVDHCFMTCNLLLSQPAMSFMCSFKHFKLLLVQIEIDEF